MRINKYLPFAFIYFFINSLGLPFGLTYTAVLSPVLYWWTVRQRKQEILLPFFVLLVPVILVHLYQGVEAKSYFISLLNYTFVYIFCQAFYTFLKTADDKEIIFRNLLIANTILCLIAIPVYFTPINEIVWMKENITEGLDNFLRLKLFTYEASYCALLCTPLFFYYFNQVIFRQNKMNSWLLLAMITLPFLLSFSIGTIACILFAVVTVFMIYCTRLIRKRRVISIVAITAAISFTALGLMLAFFPDNSLFVRIGNILQGKDTSGNGRTAEAFILAVKMLKLKTFAFGIGAGQVKTLGAEIVRDYYFYPFDFTNIAIPNATAETLALFGWVGVSFRFAVEIFLFFYTKVWTNYFRLMLFLFIFLYQFTGSFVTNIAEYVVWIMAFWKGWNEFDVRKEMQNSEQRAMI